jgi:protein required for attachment to host cells
MAGTTIAPDDWVVVCDGRKWLILNNKGDAAHVNLVTVEEREHDTASTHARGTERPGRTQSTSDRRSAVEQTDWHDQAEQEFLKALAARLDSAARAGEVSGIVLVAAPRALGMIRPLLSAAVIGLLRGELAKDYVMLPVDQIEKRLRET